MSSWIHVGVRPYAALSFESWQTGYLTTRPRKVPGGKARLSEGRILLPVDNVAFQDFEFIPGGEASALPEA